MYFTQNICKTEILDFQLIFKKQLFTKLKILYKTTHLTPKTSNKCSSARKGRAMSTCEGRLPKVRASQSTSDIDRNCNLKYLHIVPK